ncbi:Smaug 1-like 1 [Homarus americanus]|uniref:Smaug 1-like 1 n=2 Tax=Homarus americanus TaxID=6706 RepID=A0A8J5TPV2_HOMAM|nr:Smaug 1-like 1 [Homarus americanus]
MGRGVGSAGFRDQVVGLGYLWETWTEAEQVVVVYSLVRRLGPIPARFLLNVLTHTTAPDAADLAPAEATANDPDTPPKPGICRLGPLPYHSFMPDLLTVTKGS